LAFTPLTAAASDDSQGRGLKQFVLRQHLKPPLMRTLASEGAET